MVDRKYVWTGLLVLLVLVASTPALMPAVKAQEYMAIYPYSATVEQTGNTQYVIGITSYGGVTDYVYFSGVTSWSPSQPLGATATFSTVSITVPSGSTVYAYVTIAVSGAAVNTYSFTVAAVSTNWGSLTSPTATLKVITTGSSDFSITPSGNYISAYAGQSVSPLTVSVTPSGGFTGDVTLGIANPPAGSYAYFSPSIVTGGTGSSTMTMTVGAATPTGTYYLALTGTCTSPVAITKVYILYLYVTGGAGTFTLSASPTSRTVTAGQSTTYTLTVTSSAGVYVSVTLSLSGQPSGVTGTFSPSPVSVPSYSSASSTLTVDVASTTAAGTYTLTVTGTYGSASQTSSLTLIVQSAGDFSISASPTSLSIVAGQTGTSTITITSTGSFSSAVSLSFAWAGSPPTGVTPSLSSYSVTPSAGGTATSTLTVATASTTTPGSNVVRVRGDSGVLTHSVDVTFTVTSPAPAPDFTISLSASSAAIARGQSGSFTVVISSTGGFSSAVPLTLSGQPAGITGTLSPTSVTPPSGGSASSTLAVSVATTAPLGTYTLTITGTSGSLSHQASIALTVEAAAAPTPTCIIATATYGSELSPEVQFLRAFRDGTVMSTFAGSGFMKVFNAWYYSFSPYVAQFIASNAFARAVMKVLLYPLIGILHISASIYSALSFTPELAIVTVGIVASGLIGVIYFAPLSLIMLLCTKRYRKFRLSMRYFKSLTGIWIASMALICLAEITATQTIMMAATAVLVLSTLTLIASATTQRIIQKLF